MPVPSHRPSCRTMTWRTNCPDCHRRVWFFACTCGSRVFFDALGEPWPLHMDSCPIYHVRTMIHSGTDVRDIRRLLDSEARSRGLPIPPELDEYLSGYGAPGKIYFEEQFPSNEPCEIEGRVHEINRINFFKRFELNDNQIFRRLLGDLVSEPYSEVIVREAPAQQNVRIRKRWTFVAPSSQVEGLRTGMTVYAMLEGRTVIEDLAIWVGRELDWK